MDRFPRPSKPRGFDASVKAHKDRVQSHFKKKKPGKWKFEDIWSKYKRNIAVASHGKCGYCEVRVTGSQHGDVDHFYPKGEVWALHDDRTKWGQEIPGLSKVKGRKKKLLSRRGYWWLVYEWKNYVLACLVCNQQWKLSFFPVRAKRRKLPPLPRSKEKPLLLNPFFGPDPVRHLQFIITGAIIPYKGSRYGFETIRTCGLDRPSLTLDRHEKAQRAYYLLKKLTTCLPTTPEYDLTLKDFFLMGRKENVHSGMIRAIFEQETAMKWKQLEKRFAIP
ncbi:hypothetical protein [Hyalangium minutum]|uniref:hypothetical protein n=1 Tax=Hyalangium minutum TaxID=394096 RepID=UPI0012FBD575|nr:hypothetical protein [Hyalangium minutum]